MTPRFKAVAVVGAGAVGSFFGAMLARAGHRVTLIGRAAHVQAIERDGLRLHMAGRVEAVRLAATDDLAAVRGADLVLFSVKSTDTDTVARQMAPHLDTHALVLSLQNGVENAPMIARHVCAGTAARRAQDAPAGGSERSERGGVSSQMVVPAAVYVATATPAPGCVAHHGRGDLVIGALNAEGARDTAVAQRLQDLADLFASAQVPVRICDDVMAELWSKLVVNCAYNAISGLAQATYAQLAALPSIRELQHALVREVVALAAAEGVNLPLAPALAAMEQIAVAMPTQRSSTAQDMARRKPSEIDHLNGFVARRGRELGIATPVNQTLHALVKLVEAGHAGT